MKFLTLVRDIYRAPRAAFGRDDLSELIPVGLLTAVVMSCVGFMLVLKNAAWQSLLAKYPLLHRFGFVIILGSVAVAYGLMVLRTWVITQVAALQEETLAWRPLMAGFIWINIALMPTGWILTLLGLQRTSTAVVLLWGLVLNILCVQALANTTGRRAVWIDFLSWLVTFVLPMAILMVIGICVGIYLGGFGHHLLP